MYQNNIKKILDFTLAVTVILVTSPLFILITILLTIINKGNPFFLQLRPGKHGQIFKVIKFKTMSDKKDDAGAILPDAERVTKIGKLIRNSSLDELPQLINVLKGDMSIIGPRPLLVQYLLMYNDFQKRRHEVKPGITGWAQVNGRNAISWNKKFELDVWYVDNISFGLDLKIIWRTILKIIESEGINQQGEVTMEFFNGNN